MPERQGSQEDFDKAGRGPSPLLVLLLYSQINVATVKTDSVKQREQSRQSGIPPIKA